jgi:hypothetical protein
MHANALAAMTATAAATARHSQLASAHNASAVQTDLAYPRPEADSRLATSSNASSNADIRNRTAYDQLDSQCLLRWKGRTDSDDSGHG